MSKITAVPTAQQLAYADAEVGAFFHYDIEVFQPEWWDAFSLWASGKGPRPARVDLDKFNPRALNTDQWIEATVAAGATYALLTTKHNTGFSLWPTAVYDYSVRNTPWRNGKGDIVGDFVASCHRYGVKPGIYYSTATNFLYDVLSGNYVDTFAPDAVQSYNSVVLQQCTELWGNYGELFEHWFDGNPVPP